MDLYIVFDLKGAGRLVGVFDDEHVAKTLADRDPAYYKIYSTQLNEVNPDTLAWASSEDQRAFLESLFTRFEKKEGQ